MYVIFNQPSAAAQALYVRAVLAGTLIETSFRKAAFEFATARAAYNWAGQFKQLQDWRVGTR